MQNSNKRALITCKIHSWPLQTNIYEWETKSCFCITLPLVQQHRKHDRKGKWSRIIYCFSWQKNTCSLSAIRVAWMWHWLLFTFRLQICKCENACCVTGHHCSSALAWLAYSIAVSPAVIHQKWCCLLGDFRVLLLLGSSLLEMSLNRADVRHCGESHRLQWCRRGRKPLRSLHSTLFLLSVKCSHTFVSQLYFISYICEQVLHTSTNKIVLIYSLYCLLWVLQTAASLHSPWSLNSRSCHSCGAAASPVLCKE